jgi:hypothetical protein
VAYNINAPGGGLVTVSPTGTSGASTTTPGTSEAAQFYFYNATDPTSPLPISSGSTTILQSEGSDKFCRLVPMQGSMPPPVGAAAAAPKVSSSSSSSSGSFRTRSIAAAAPPGFLLTLVCDVTDPSQATPLTYTSTGLTYNGQPLVPNGPGGAMVVQPAGTTSGTATTTTPITPAGPVVVPGLPITIETVDGFLSVPNTNTSMFPNATGTGTSAAEQFVLTPATGSPTSPVLPGTVTVVQSVATGMYCRVVNGSTAGSQEIKCDQPTPATATPMTYTGSGLVYQGLVLGTNGSGVPATFSGANTIDPSSPPGSETVVDGAGVDAAQVTPGTSLKKMR